MLTKFYTILYRVPCYFYNLETLSVEENSNLQAHLRVIKLLVLHIFNFKPRK